MNGRHATALGLVIALALAGCLQVAPAPGATAPDADGDAGAQDGLREAHEFFAIVTAAPAAPAEETFTFTVPQGATEVWARLAWVNENARMNVFLLDPSGAQQARGFAETTTTRTTATAAPPAPGEWTARVEATEAVDEAFALEVVVTDATAEFQAIEERYEVETRHPSPASTLQHGGFAEINLVMAEGEWFNYSWSADQEVYFNVHYHGEDGTERPVEERTDAHEGRFTAPFAEVFSLVWRNEQPTTATVEATVEGVFREHSRTR